MYLQVLPDPVLPGRMHGVVSSLSNSLMVFPYGHRLPEEGRILLITVCLVMYIIIIIFIIIVILMAYFLEVHHSLCCVFYYYCRTHLDAFVS